MANEKTKVVVAVPSFQPGFHTTMFEQLKKFIKPEEMILRTLSDDPNAWKDSLRRILEHVRPSALVAMDIRPDSDTIKVYNDAGVPIIIIDEEATGVSTVAVNNFKGGQIAGQYLVQRGRKKIGIVSGKTEVKGGYNAKQRLKGFQQALTANQVKFWQGCSFEVVHYSKEDGLEVMPHLLKAGVDAIFCAAGDNCALGLLAVAKERGVRIPEEIAVVGFDDLLIAQLSAPRLTTIRQPLEKMAEAAYKIGVVCRDETLNNPQRAVFDPELVIRESA